MNIRIIHKFHPGIQMFPGKINNFPTNNKIHKHYLNLIIQTTFKNEVR